MAFNIPTSLIARPSKIYPNWDFWFENISSGNSDGLDTETPAGMLNCEGEM
jgi:hypothetical protein